MLYINQLVFVDSLSKELTCCQSVVLKVLCVGYRKVNFTVKESGEVISGYSCYLAEEFSSHDKVECYGHLTDKIFLSDKKMDDFGMKALCRSEKPFKLLYNRYGKIDSIIPLS